MFDQQPTSPKPNSSTPLTPPSHVETPIAPPPPPPPPPLTPHPPINTGLVMHPNTPPAAPLSVHTMPAKFLPPDAKGSKTLKRRLLIVGIIICMLLVVVGIVAYAFVFAPTTNETKNTVNIANTQNNKNTTKDDANKNVNATNTNTTNTNTADTNTANTNAANINTANTNETNTNTLNTNGINANIPANTNGTNVNQSATGVSDEPDKDRDGLTDEEEGDYQTKVHLPDTDSDGFVDGTEVLNLYSPIAAGKKLAESGLVIEYNNKKGGWSMMYPATWVAEALTEKQQEVVFSPNDSEGELVQVIMTDNPTGVTAAEWYLAQNTQAQARDLASVIVGGFDGIVLPGGLTYYVATSNHIIAIVYNYGSKTALTYRTTFQMMLKSMTITGTPVTVTQ